MKEMIIARSKFIEKHGKLDTKSDKVQVEGHIESYKNL